MILHNLIKRLQSARLVSRVNRRERLSEKDATWLANYLHPEIDDMWKRKLIRKLEQGEIMLRQGLWACNVCGGNCGQCGDTGFFGNIGFDMQHLVDRISRP